MWSDEELQLYRKFLTRDFIQVLISFHFLGTRIIYERKFLLELRNSPLSRTPPRNLALIPGVTCDVKEKPMSPKDNGVTPAATEGRKTEQGIVGDTLPLFVITIISLNQNEKIKHYDL